MRINGKVHCFFEQSGTFKREFIKLGIPAEDYDIQNNFGETDHTEDLFKAIEDAYDGKPSLYEAQKWLREEKKIDVLVYLDDLKGYYYYIRVWEGNWEMAIKHDKLCSKGITYNEQYESALNEGIKQAINILKEEK